MRILFAITAATLLLAGCASAPATTQVAAADCKIAPLQLTSSGYGNKRQPTSLERSAAVADLSRSDVRLRELSTGLGQAGMLEEALRDCNR